jgi:hypothetical protein
MGVEGCVTDLEAAMARLVELAGLLVPPSRSAQGGAEEMGA